MAEPDLGGARRGGRRDGAVRGEQEPTVDEEPASAFPRSPSTSSFSFSAARERHGRDGGPLGGEDARLDPLHLGSAAAGAEAPPRAVAQDPHPTPPPLSLLRQVGPDNGRRCPRALSVLAASWLL